MSDRHLETYLAIDKDPADDLLHVLRSRLGHLEPADLTDSFMRVIVQVWQQESCREAVERALAEVSGAHRVG